MVLFCFTFRSFNGILVLLVGLGARGWSLCILSRRWRISYRFCKYKLCSSKFPSVVWKQKKLVPRIFRYPKAIAINSCFPFLANEYCASKCQCICPIIQSSCTLKIGMLIALHTLWISVKCESHVNWSECWLTFTGFLHIRLKTSLSWVTLHLYTSVSKVEVYKSCNKVY